MIFLHINLNICFWCSKEPSHWDCYFEYPQHMFWMRNKENNFPICTLIWRPVAGWIFMLLMSSWSIEGHCLIQWLTQSLVKNKMKSNFYLLISYYIRNLFDRLHVLSMFFTCNYDICLPGLQVNQKTGVYGNLEFYFSSDQSRLTVVALIWIASAIYPLKCKRFSWNIVTFLLFF